ncbi:MAG: polyphenol oxidase family protein [Eggerthellaceae bacterium]|jgi:YfiH family protein
MATTPELPLPQLVKGRFSFSGQHSSKTAGSLRDDERTPIIAFSDPILFMQTGVRIAFTQRTGGTSKVPYDSLNLGTHVKDCPDDVAENRRRVLSAFGVPDDPLLVPNQVHGRNVTVVDSAVPTQLAAIRTAIAAGSDGLVVSVSDVAALLCYADCVPLIMVAPHGTFAVVHAGWRGVDNNIAPHALELLLDADGTIDPSRVNVYRGPYIHAECFETGPEVYRRFVSQFGPEVLVGTDHVDMGRALDISLVKAGIDPRRIADVDSCTMCHNQEWFSYRAQGGVCGRHGAFAVRVVNASA